MTCGLTEWCILSQAAHQGRKTSGAEGLVPTRLGSSNSSTLAKKASRSTTSHCLVRSADAFRAASLMSIALHGHRCQRIAYRQASSSWSAEARHSMRRFRCQRQAADLVWPAISAAESVLAFSFIFLMRSSVWDCFLRSFLKWAESYSRRPCSEPSAAHDCPTSTGLQGGSSRVTLLIS